MAESKTARLKTTGMHCQSCAMLIEMNLGDLEGVESSHADFRTGETEVHYDPEKVDVDRIVATIAAAGYGAEPEPQE